MSGAAMPRVERYEGTPHEWDAFARTQRGFTHYHQYRWRALVERVFGHECVYLAARDADGALCGVLPLVRVRSLVFGHFLVSMPFVDYGGPIGSDAAVAALTGFAAALATEGRARLLEFRSRVELPIALPASHRKVGVVLDLHRDTDRLFAGFPAKLRSQVRRPQKEGVTMAFGHDEVDAFFHVYSRNMRDLGTPTQPRRFFRAIAEAFPDDCTFAVAYLRGAPVAAGCGFTAGGEFSMAWGSSLRECSREAPNMLMYWASIERAAQAGVPLFNFGRSSPGSGTWRFKMQWSGREIPLWWYQHSERAGAKTPSPDDSAFAWGPRLWRRLPTAVATAIGPAIVRYIP